MTDIERDPWSHLTRFTSARIAVGRSGGSLRTSTQLELRLAHARARDAIQRPFDVAALESQLSACEIAHECLSTQAMDRDAYLLDPGKGRQLSESSRETLVQKRNVWKRRALVVVVSDGLSALAAERQVLPTLAALLPLTAAAGITLYPVLLVPFARVKLGDEIGALLQAELSLILLGERPGLSAPDSLGAYVTYGPNASRTDADRNCVSNIRPGGVPPALAARQIAAIVWAARKRLETGVGLKLDGSEDADLRQTHPLLVTAVVPRQQ